MSLKRPGRKPRVLADIDADIVQQLKTQWKKVGACKVWTGLYLGNNYGRISRHLRRASFHFRAHIAAYQFYIGPVPTGLFVCHTCDNKGCINPKHLWLGTNQQNQQDASVKGISQRAWTKELREQQRIQSTGSNNPMYGRCGKDAPAYGRTGAKHPMFGKHHTVESKKKTSVSLLKFHQQKDSK